ncbi:MAG TPA: hypothetical protein VGJ73_22530 [Verrucomicrobiae bacterium]|jgi:hypothetical protein
MIASNAKLSTILKSALHKACWHVSVGGCTLPTFSLAIGEKTKRNRTLRNPAQPIVFRKYEPEISFYVWCAWRLEYRDEVIASNDGGDGEIERGLKRIIGKSILKMEIMPPAWDFVMHFDGSLRLVVFCNYAGKKPTFSCNWQAKVQHTRIIAGPGSELEIAQLK